MSKKNELAISGGNPAVRIPPPHFTWPIIGDKEIQAVLDQLQTSNLSYRLREGIIKTFEDEFARAFDSNYAISTHSGTAALHAAFFCLDLPFGSHILAPAYTHLATVFPMLHVGLLPVLCDIDEHTGNIDPEEITAKLTEETKAIIVTHQYGHLCEMEEISGIAKERSLFVIEDCSHAHGSTLYGKKAGTFGDIACFSLQSHKTVWGGEGGILITNNPEMADRASLFGHFRQEREYTPEKNRKFVNSGYGLKNRLHPLAAALALVQLRKMPAVIQKRAENYECFLNAIKNIPGIRPLLTRDGIDRGGFFRFIFKYHPEEVNGLPIETYIAALQAEGVNEIMPGSLAKPIHYFSLYREIEEGKFPLFSEPWLKTKAEKMKHGNHNFPKAERFSKLTIQFPAFTDPSSHIIHEYAGAMRKVAKNAEFLKKNKI